MTAWTRPARHATGVVTSSPASAADFCYSGWRRRALPWSGTGPWSPGACRWLTGRRRPLGDTLIAVAEPKPHRVMEIQKRKRPDGTGTWSGYVIRRDEHGLWLFTPRGWRYRGESTGGVDYVEVGQGDRPAGVDVLHLAPRDQWWFAAWHIIDEPTVTIDICVPPAIVDSRLLFIDLEIDLWKQRGGDYGVADEDEFEAACAAGWIDDNERTSALSATAELQGRLAGRDLLFEMVGWEAFERCRGLNLDPLPDGV